MIVHLPEGTTLSVAPEARLRPRLIVAEAIGAVTPDRYGRITEFAMAHELDPRAVLDLATCVQVYPPEHLMGNAGRSYGVRRRAEVGEGSWSEVLAEIHASAEAVIGRPWDAARYGAFLAAGGGISLRWGVIAALRACQRAGIPVVLTVTAPAEFAVGLRALLGGAGLPLVLTADCGAHKDDGSLWEICRRDHAPESTPGDMLVIDDAWGWCVTAAQHGATAWWLESDADSEPLASALTAIAAAAAAS